MRRNILLHFMNRDSREIFGYFALHDEPSHFRILRRALNIAVLLCEDHCIMPPGFLIEDDIAFRLAEAQQKYLSARIIQFPLREKNLTEYAEKKRVDYHPMRNRYSGLFDDTRLDFLGRNAQGLINRKSQITERIAEQWEAGPDNKGAIWTPIKRLLTADKMESIRTIPHQLMDSDSAVTWSAIEPKLDDAERAASSELRDALQHVYLKQYCSEFGLLVLAEVPQATVSFALPSKPRSYSYDRFCSFLDCFDLKNLFCEANAQFIIELKRHSGAIDFLDAYVQLAEASKSRTDLSYHASQIARSVKFDWSAFSKRINPLIQSPSDVELSELAGALEESAQLMRSRFQLDIRPPNLASAENRQVFASPRGRIMPSLVLFVALEEELRILEKELSLVRHPTQPMASGSLNAVDVAVVCPKSMGRVAAAVAMSKYLESRKTHLPTVVLIVGLAGGFPEEDVRVGQILCAETVVDLANRKVSDEGDQAKARFRRKDFTLSTSLRDLLQSQNFDRSAWVQASIEKAQWPDDKRPTIKFGLIASADEVVASDVWRKQLLTHTEKLLGVEMEAGGVCAAAASFKVPVCMLRAVSDDADPSKGDDEWRKRGMITIAELLKHTPIDELIQLEKAN